MLCTEEFKLNVTRAKEVIIMPEAFAVAESEILLDHVTDIRIQEDAFRNSITTKVSTFEIWYGLVKIILKLIFPQTARYRQQCN